MKHTIWFGVGLVILMGAYFVREKAQDAANLGQQMNYDVVNFLIMAGAMFCFFMGFQAAMQHLRESKESEKMRNIRRPAGTVDPLDNSLPESTFDADAALARYLESKGETPSAPEPKSEASTPVERGFGRKSS